MIARTEFSKAVNEAYRVFDEYFNDDANHGRGLLVRPGGTETARLKAKQLVRRSGQATLVYSRGIKSGYGSWLMYTDGRWIGVNKSQLHEWASDRLQSHGSRGKRFWNFLFRVGSKNYGHAHRLGFRSMEVRCILHELGHILLQPHLLDRNRLNREAVPSDEEAAWVFALTLLGILLGDHAFLCRTREGTDDSPLVLV